MNIDISYDIQKSSPLCEIMEKEGSDKGSRGNAQHNYTRFYYELFKNVIDKKLRVFELGLGTNNTKIPSNMDPGGVPGASLRGWRSFFPNADIFGADIDRDILFTEERIKTFYCDQTNPDVILDMWDREFLEDDFDIIIEDGLHTVDANITFFENSIHKLKPGGIYIIEDIIHDNIKTYKNKIEEWKIRYSNIRFRLEIIPHTNKHDNILLIAQKTYSSIKTIVTGADSTHFKTLCQLLRNLFSFDLTNTNIVVYNLGLSIPEIKTLLNSFPKIIYKKFNYRKYPDYLNIKIKAGEYAWKPVIIYETCKNFGGLILWTDSGNLFTDINLIKDIAIYSSTSSGDIKKWTHQKTLDHMNVPTEWYTFSNRNAALLFFDYNIDWVRDFIEEFYLSSLIKERIAPEGSSRDNHRQDQSIYTILYYKYHEKYNFKMIDENLGFKTHNDID